MALCIIIPAYGGVITTWILYYLGKSITSQLPWSTCDHVWNTPFCHDRTQQDSLINSTLEYNSTKASIPGDTDSHLSHLNSTFGQRTPAEEFWQCVTYWYHWAKLLLAASWNHWSHSRFEVLDLSDSIDHLGGIRWQLALTHLASWTLVFLCLCKSIKSVGRVIYITAIAPYIFLTILLIRGLLLPGALDGILYFLTPNMNQLLKFNVSIINQILYCLHVATNGSLLNWHILCLRIIVYLRVSIWVHQWRIINFALHCKVENRVVSHFCIVYTHGIDSLIVFHKNISVLVFYSVFPQINSSKFILSAFSDPSIMKTSLWHFNFHQYHFQRNSYFLKSHISLMAVSFRI